MGGKYRTVDVKKKQTRKGLVKWFREDWRDISTKDKSGKHPKCGRSAGSKRGYPKCVPRFQSSFNERIAKETGSSPQEGDKACPWQEAHIRKDINYGDFRTRFSFHYSGRNPERP